MLDDHKQQDILEVINRPTNIQKKQVESDPEHRFAICCNIHASKPRKNIENAVTSNQG
jgi:hypothetical protein